MHVIAVDDERLPLEDLQDICSQFPSVQDFYAFSNPTDALEHAARHKIDLAFLDIEMPVMTGLELAKRLNRIDPEIRIVFVTGFKEYAYDAFSVNAIGYVLKPFSDEMIREQIEKAEAIPQKKPRPDIFVHTFGYFDVFYQNKPVYVATENAIATLWPDREYDETVQSLFRKVLKSLRVSLADAGISEILVDARNQRSVDTEKFACDFYELLDKKESAMENYSGEYMVGYTWAEPTRAHIQKILGGK